MSTWPRHRGPIAVPVAAIGGTILIIALLANGANSRIQQVQRRAAAQATSTPTLVNGYPADSAAAIGAPTPTPTVTPASTSASTPPSGSSGTATTPSSGSSSTSTAKSVPTTPSYAAPMTNAALAVVKAWQQPTVAGRAAALAKKATPAYIALIATADPARTPKSPPKSSTLVAESDGFARVGVTLADGTSILVDLANTKGIWLATDIAPGG